MLNFISYRQLPWLQAFYQHLWSQHKWLRLSVMVGSIMDQNQQNGSKTVIIERNVKTSGEESIPKFQIKQKIKINKRVCNKQYFSPKSEISNQERRNPATSHWPQWRCVDKVANGDHPVFRIMTIISIFKHSHLHSESLKSLSESL